VVLGGNLAALNALERVRDTNATPRLSVPAELEWRLGSVRMSRAQPPPHSPPRYPNACCSAVVPAWACAELCASVERNKNYKKGIGRGCEEASRHS
jgi:hypothetical protein